MNVQVTNRPTGQPAATSKLAIADGDIHPQRNSYKDLFPYMEQRWIDMAKTFGFLKNSNYKGYCSMEFDSPGDPNQGTSDLIAETLKFLA